MTNKNVSFGKILLLLCSMTVCFWRRFFIVTRGTLSLVMVCRSDHVYARLTRVWMSLFFFSSSMQIVNVASQFPCSSERRGVAANGDAPRAFKARPPDLLLCLHGTAVIVDYRTLPLFFSGVVTILCGI